MGVAMSASSKQNEFPLQFTKQKIIDRWRSRNSARAYRVLDEINQKPSIFGLREISAGIGETLPCALMKHYVNCAGAGAGATVVVFCSKITFIVLT